jgi:hypothetical protein
MVLEQIANLSLGVIRVLSSSHSRSATFNPLSGAPTTVEYLVVAGGGGGGGFTSGGGGGGYSVSMVGQNGASGIVILRYPAIYSPAVSVTGSPSTYISGYWRVYIWTTSGSITF